METVSTVCTQVRNKTSRNTSFRSLLTKIRREFRLKHFDLTIKSHRTDTLDQEEFYVNAYYDPENDSNYDTPVEVIIIHNFDKSVTWDRKHITDLLVQIFDAVVHEYKHQLQSVKKDHKIFWKQSSVVKEYLSDPDEIDAYALSISIELCRSIGKYRALQHMRHISSMSQYRTDSNLISPNLYSYFKVFETITDPVLRKLSKKIYKILLEIDADLVFV